MAETYRYRLFGERTTSMEMDYPPIAWTAGVVHRHRHNEARTLCGLSIKRITDPISKAQMIGKVLCRKCYVM